MHIIYDNFFLKHHTGNFHPENAGRLVAIKKYLDRSRLFKKIVFTDPYAATAGQVCMVHEREYVAKVRKLSESGLIYYLDADTVVSPDTYNCAMLAAGGCLNGIDFLLRNEKDVKYFFALVRPPGHHAFPSSGSGFCIFNNISIAAKYAIKNYGLQRIAIIDFDVHHGNGTQEIFYEDNRVFYTSIHQYPHYPGTGYWTQTGEKEGKYFNLNIPVTAYSEESDYITAFTDIIIPLLYDYEPELILVSAGFDAHSEDPLSSVNLNDMSYYKLMRLIVFLKHMVNLKNKDCCRGVGLFLEGGYAIDATASSVLKVIEACLEKEEFFDIDGIEIMKNRKINTELLKSVYLGDSVSKPGINIPNLKTFESIRNIFGLHQVH